MNPQAVNAQTPDGQVADSIVEQLFLKSLIASAQVSEIFRGLANGSLKAVDWRLIAEKALEMEVRDGKAAH